MSCSTAHINQKWKWLGINKDGSANLFLARPLWNGDQWHVADMDKAKDVTGIFSSNRKCSLYKKAECASFFGHLYEHYTKHQNMFINERTHMLSIWTKPEHTPKQLISEVQV